MLYRTTCAPGTRVQLLRSIIAWAEDASEDTPNVFWLFGPAGSGKSTIAYTIARHFTCIDHTDDEVITLGANFFCSRQFEQTRESRWMIRTIVHHLARVCKPFALALSREGNLDSIGHGISAQIQDLLVKPWRASKQDRDADPSTSAHYVVIIDALDEIDGNGGSMFLEHLFDALNRDYLPGLKFFATIRLDPDLVSRVLCFERKWLFRLQDIGKEEAWDDIKKYLSVDCRTSQTARKWKESLRLWMACLSLQQRS